MSDVSTLPDRAVRVGYLLRMYPRFTQTFVVNEILELERQNLPLCIGSLKRPNEGQFHESISRVRARVDYLPEYLVESPRKFASAHGSVLGQRPWGYLRSLGVVLRASGAHWTDFLQAALVVRWARKRKLDHLHVHFGSNEASVAYLARLMGGPPYSLTLHAFDIFRDSVDRRLLARKINASRFTVTVSEYNRRYLLEHFPGLDPARIRVNYNGIDQEWFQPGAEPRKPWSVVAVGRLIEKKGFIHLVRAVGLLRDRGLPVRCQMVGEGPEETALRKEIAALELAAQIELTGPQTQSQVRKLLAESMCLVLPCVRARDGNLDALPTVLLEAMACGCPCVSTRLSGVPEIIEDGQSGLLVPPGDEQALADAVAGVLEDAPLRSRLSAGGRRRVEDRFDIRQNVARLRSWLWEAAEPTVQAETDFAVPARPALEC